MANGWYSKAFGYSGWLSVSSETQGSYGNSDYKQRYVIKARHPKKLSASYKRIATSAINPTVIDITNMLLSASKWAHDMAKSDMSDYGIECIVDVYELASMFEIDMTNFRVLENVMLGGN